MKTFNIKYRSLVLCCGLGLMLGFSACSDEHMAEVNTDDSKAEVINPNSLLTTALLQTYGDFGLMDTYRSYITGFTQQFAGGWNVTSYGGSNFKKDDQMSLVWDKFYSVGLKNLADGIRKSDDKKNVNAVMRVHRVYMYSVLTDLYGDVPCFNACTGYSTPEYDTQESIYRWFFSELEECIAQLGTGGDNVTGDVTAYDGNTAQWRKYANSLRMRFAMRISDVLPELAQQEFEKAVAAECGYIATAADNAYVRYLNVPYTLYQGAEDLDFRANAFGEIMYGQDMNSPTFICATFFELLQQTHDPRLWRICRYFWNNDRSEIRPDGENIDVTEQMLSYFAAKGFNMNDFAPEIGTAWYDNPKEDWKAPSAEDVAQYLPSLVGKADVTANNCHIRMKIPFFNVDMERPQTPGILMTSAEVNFLLAEAASKGWKVKVETEKAFEAGVRDAMHLLGDYYFSGEESYGSAISESEIDAYLDQLHPDFSTADKARETIGTQAYILHLTNPSECWANLRRADYPVIKDRRLLPKLGNFSREEDLTVPVRLCYPMLEAEYNTANYRAALARIDGTDNWHKRMWWDKYDQHMK